MKKTSNLIQVTGVVFSVLMSAAVIGGTAAAMTATAALPSTEVIVLDHMIVAAPGASAVN